MKISIKSIAIWKKLLFVVTVPSLLLSILSGCGTSSKTVPDSYIQRFVENSDEYYSDSAILEAALFSSITETKLSGDYDKKEWTAKHKTDKSSHLDTVTITLVKTGNYGTCTSSCSPIFQYNKQSDLWNIIDEGEWSNETYSFNGNLRGNWSISTDRGCNSINIKSVKDGTIKLEYEISSYLLVGFSDQYWTFEGEATADANDTYFDIPVDIGKGTCMYGSDPVDLERSTGRLSVGIDPVFGVHNAYFDYKMYEFY